MGDRMKIKKVLNNNAVIALNDNKQDVIVTGLGIAFQKKKGDIIEPNKIEKVFVGDSGGNNERIVKLLEEIPKEYIDVSEDILKYANNVFARKVSENTIITLADHLYFATKRLQNGLDVRNPLIWEVKQYYRDEYKVALYSLEIIENKLSVKFPEDEAAGIAIHLANTKLDDDLPEIYQVINILQDSLKIIKDHFNVELEDNEISYQRMVTHLKFFAQRIIKGEGITNNDDMIYDIIKEKYPESYKCAKKIAKYAKDKHNFNVSRSETTFLTVHIERVISSSTNSDN